jgi:hypothetical protein
MLRRIKDMLDRSPRTGWLLALMFLVAGVLLFVRLRASPGTYSYERMTQDVRVRCAETGEEWIVKRGRMESELLRRQGQINAAEGLTNPKTGKATGFPINEWQETIDRLNGEKEALAAGRRGDRLPSK